MDDETHENPGLMIVEGSVAAPDAAPVRIDDHKAGLTDQQLRFAQAFVENGGKSGDAALTAGYGHDTYGTRLLAKRKVQDEIARRVKLQSGSALAIALSGLFRVIEDGEDERAVVQAALGLMDRFGMAPPKGPAVALQVNNITGNDAQAILIDVQQRRLERLARQQPA